MNTPGAGMRPMVGWCCILSLGLLAACGGGSDSIGPTPTDIAGAWRAAKAEFTGGTPKVTVDVVSSGGSATLELGANGAFAFTLQPAGRAAEVTNGSYRLDGDVMTVIPAGVPFIWQFDVDLSGDRLRLSGARVEFDVNGDGRDELAVLDLELVR